jgi:hypothetical protein
MPVLKPGSICLRGRTQASDIGGGWLFVIFIRIAVRERGGRRNRARDRYPHRLQSRHIPGGKIPHPLRGGAYPKPRRALARSTVLSGRTRSARSPHLPCPAERSAVDRRNGSSAASRAVAAAFWSSAVCCRPSFTSHALAASACNRHRYLARFNPDICARGPPTLGTAY